MLGVRKSGKSTVLNCLHITLVSQANQKHLRYRIHEYRDSTMKNARVAGQRQSASEMRNGRFPEPTPKGTTFEADMEIIWNKKGLFGQEKSVSLPIIDIAGEEVAEMIKDLSLGTYKIPQILSIGNMLHDRILQADGFILIVQVSKINIGGVQIEPEAEDNISDYPDNNLAHIVERVYDYKKKHGSRPIKAIAVILTQIDKVSGLLKADGIDLQTEDGRHKFMSLYFPETYVMLNFIGLDKVKMIPSWVHLVYDPVSKRPILHPLPYEDGTRSPLINMVKGERIENGKLIPYVEPDFNRDGNLELINWLKEHFAS